MRRLAFVVFTLALAGCNSVSWQPVNPQYSEETVPRQYSWTPLFADLHSICYSGRSGVWAVGARGALLHSINGLTWEAVDTHVVEDLYAITCSDGNLAAVGNHGTVLNSVDGQEWTPRTITSDALLSVYGIDGSRKLWAVGGKGTILHTNDGEHWERQDSTVGTALRSVAGDGPAIWIVGDAGVVLQSADGEHWIRRTAPSADLNSLFVAGSGLWALGGKSTIFHASKSGNDWVSQYEHPSGVLFHLFGDRTGAQIWAVGYQGLILHTSDGASWTTAVPAVSTKLDLSMLRGGTMSTDGSEAWVVGSEMKILHSAKGGEWRAETEAGQSFLPNAISGSHEQRKLFIVGSGLNANALYSSDERAWQPQMIGVPPEMAAAATAYGLASVNSVSMVAGRGDVWAVGHNGKVLHSRDSGGTWSAPRSEISSNLASVFSTEQGMWAVGDAIVTCDNSDHCVPQTDTNSAYLYSISGDVNGKHLWAVGLSGRIMSFDGGKWTTLTSPTKESLASVFATRNGERVFAVGDSGTILRSDNGHNWAIRPSPTKANLRSVFFAKDGARGWVVGDYSGVKARDVPSSESEGTILQTTDGGEHWAEMSVPGLPRGIFGSDDAAELWIIGSRSWHVHSIKKPATFLAGAALSGTPDHAQLMLQLQNFAGARSDIHISLSALNDFKYARHWAPQADFPYTIGKSGNRPDVLVASFNPRDLEVGSGSKVHFSINVTADGFSQVYEFAAIYDPWRWFLNNAKWLLPSLAMTMIAVVLTVVLFKRPLWLLWLYRHLKLSDVEKIKLPALGDALQLLVRLLTVLPILIKTNRVLDAWVQKNRNAVKEAAKNDLDSLAYMPLPIRVGDFLSGEALERPESVDIRKLMRGTRVTLQIVGPGGAGKTMLARQIARWAFDGEVSDHPTLAVFVDEELDPDKNDRTLASVVRGRLAAALPDEEIEDELYYALLRKQRILVIVDRLSERSSKTQDHIRSIYRKSKIGLLLLTSRTVMAIDGTRSVDIYPEPLDSSTLLYFVTSLIKFYRAQKESAGGFSRIREQTELGNRLAGLISIRTENGEEDVPLLPLPVRLFVEQAFKLIREGRSLDELPSTLPEIYFLHLRLINPQDQNSPHFLDNEAMFKVAKALAKLAVGSDYVPKEFPRQAAAPVLLSIGEPISTQRDPLERLKLNGVLMEKPAGLGPRYRFTLDPIAEFLAAVAYAEEFGSDPDRWQQLVDGAKTAPGYIAALKLVRQAYYSSFFAIG